MVSLLVGVSTIETYTLIRILRLDSLVHHAKVLLLLFSLGRTAPDLIHNAVSREVVLLFLKNGR